jgi:hypothetical protein
MSPRILLALLALALAAAMFLSNRPWAATSMPRIDEIAALPDTPEAEAATSGAAVGIVLPYDRDQALRQAKGDALGSGSRLGYSYRETSIARLPLWASRELGFVKFTPSPDGYYAEPLGEEQLEGLKAAVGKDYAGGYVFPFWAHMWGWLFAIGLLGWFYLNHRAQAKWRAETGII